MTTRKDGSPLWGLPAEDQDTDTLVQALLDREERRLLADAPQAEDGIDSWHALVADPHFVRRSTVLARSSPLHRLDLRQAWQRFPSGLYDPRTLALAALEAVVSRQEMELEATTEEVLGFLASLACRAAPEREAAEHVAVARFVLRELLNDHEGGCEFAVPYSDYRQGHSRGEVSFRLLEEAFGRHGQAVLRASVSAVNLLLVGLDHDLEDQQAAHDEMLRRQVATGRWERAEQSAGESLKLSLAYAQRLRSVLVRTERDVRSVDWAVRVPALLGSARAHLLERQRVECELMELMRGRRNEVEDGPVRLACVRILRLLERAYLRHTQLLEQVIGARPAFLRSQAEQRFRPMPQLSVVALRDELLAPLLDLSAQEAAEVAGLFSDLSGGPVVSRLPRLQDYLSLLLAPVREPCASFPDEDVEVFVDPLEDVPVYECEHYAAARELLEQALVGPVRMSRLLEQAIEVGWKVADLLALSVLGAFAPDPEDALDGGGELADLLQERLVVLEDGTGFDLGPLAGSDLLLVPAQPLIPEPSRAGADVDLGVLA
jgi:hypothetical protein